MKKVYIIKQHHMDAVWRRCWDRNSPYRNKQIRSYAQIEELILNRDLELMKVEPSYVTSVEQAITVKKYLERNPDKEGLFQKLVQSGNIELLSGGETIVDTNLVYGETIVRNHLYPLRYYKEKFGFEPWFTVVTDAFGVNAQLPQFYRKLGYVYVTQICRNYKCKKPYWRGIDGTLVCFRELEDDLRNQTIKANFISLESYSKYEPCTVCNGMGCEHCEFTGLDLNAHRYDDSSWFVSPNRYEAGDVEHSFREALKFAAESDAEETYISFNSEETLLEASMMREVQKAKEQYQLDIQFVQKGSLYKAYVEDDIKKMLENPELIQEDEIDRRVEDMPVSTGCYVSRIRTKQLLRKCEMMVINAEKLCSLAAVWGYTEYPRKKIERLWSLISFIAFHDAVTATHTDKAFDEIIDAAQNVLLGAKQIMKEASAYINSQIQVEEKHGMRPFVIYNLLPNEKKGIHSVVLPFDGPLEGAQIYDEDGHEMTVVNVEIFDLAEKRYDVFHERFSAKIDFAGAEISPMGYRVFYIKPSQALLVEYLDTNIAENKYYRIRCDKYGITEIFDKELNEVILEGYIGDLHLEEDFGSPWETLAKPFNPQMIRKYARLKEIKKINGRVQIRIEGSYNEEQHIFVGKPQDNNWVSWVTTVTLEDTKKIINFKTDITWNTKSRRIKLQFPMAFETGDSAYYEIPYGIIKRKKYEGIFGIHSQPNGEWPAVNYIQLYNEEKDYSVALLNKGLPSYRVENNTVFLSVLRSPEIPVFIYDFEGALDAGTHTFEYSIYSRSGGIEKGDTAQIALELNMPILAEQVRVNDGKRQAGLFDIRGGDHVVLAAMKLAEDDDRALILRFNETGMRDGEIRINCNFDVKGACIVDLMERETGSCLTSGNSIICPIKKLEILSLKVKF